jgi:protein-S-isoprenylcysteine O-methyltransferase Ste14
LATWDSKHFTEFEFSSLGRIVWAIFLFAAIIDRVFIRFEEQLMATKFGEDYKHYCGQLRRWL